MINGVIFDMDGLMFDTERMWATFWEPALAALGLEYKEGLAEAERGTAGETSRNIVRQFYGEDCDANAIIDSLEPITEFDLDGVEPTFHPIGDLSNVMRDDEVRGSFTQEVALENAPKQEDGSFLIPSILGEGGDR